MTGSIKGPTVTDATLPEALEKLAAEATERKFALRLASEEQRNGYEVGYFDALSTEATRTATNRASEEHGQGASLRDRAGRASPQAPAGLDHTATIPCAAVRWGLLDYTTTKLDGRTRHLVFENRLPVMFCTRREARAYAEKRFGYIRLRPDLQREPHCWRIPRAIRVQVSA